MKILLDYTYDQIVEIVQSLGEPKFRAKQLWDWLVKGYELDEMSNLPKTFVQKLQDEGYKAMGVEIAQCLVSKLDGTKKYIFRLYDGNVIEGVLMKYKYGNTICVSTQVGCRMNCAFCASGLGGLVRNLSAGEILGQVIAVNRDNMDGKDRAITNIVLMGSGEPLDNYDNVTSFLRLVSSDDGLNISRRNISLSTCGLVDNIKRLADENLGVTMTISLHAPNDELRKTIMPIAKRYSIQEIMQAVRYYFDKTGRRIIFEYSMIDGKNDSVQCADELAKLVKGLSCHINLIKLNYVKERGLSGTKIDRVKAFIKRLEEHNVSCSLRRTMGSDIDGACGQLRRKFIAGEVGYQD